MLPDRVSNPGPLTYESGVLPIALRGPCVLGNWTYSDLFFYCFCIEENVRKHIIHDLLYISSRGVKRQKQ